MIGIRMGIHRGKAVAATWPSPITNNREMGMSSKPKSKGGTELQTNSALAEAGEAPVGNAVRTEEIRRRAYEVYVERGEQPDHELDDWLQAELELGALCRTQAGYADNQ